MQAVKRFRRATVLLLAAAGALIALTAAGCGGGDDNAASGGTTGETTKPASLNVALDWFPNPDHVALYYALDKGYFDDQNLTVNFKKPSDPSAGLKLVATKRFDLAVYYEGDMFFAAEQGLPVIAVGTLIPTPLNSMIALSDSKVQGPSTIKGATIGVAGLPFDDAILQTMRQQEGLSEGDVKKVNVGFNLVPALLSKKADAVIGAYWNIEGNQVELETGKKPVIIRLEQIGVPHYDELVIVANKDRLASDSSYADAVKRFLAGMRKGSQGAPSNRAEAIDIIKKETDYKPKEIDLMVPATLATLKPQGGLAVGCIDLEAWETFGKWMLDNKLLKKAIDAKTVASDKYLPGC
jgi:putative hydroxymethylpyrimidine transport system substrate-binding protein